MPGAGVSPVRKRDPSQLPIFSGNGTAVAAMRAALHQCPPSGGEEGGGSAAIWPYFLSAPNADSHVFLNRVGHVVGHIDKSDLKIVS